MTLKAFAKLNIGLKIVKKREDGYHDVETTLTTINLSDIIEMEEHNSGITVFSDGISLPQEENLCYQAACLIGKTCKLTRGVKIRVIKNIPVGGGLGGGSSDAAGVLKGMNKLFGLGLGDDELCDLSIQLGSDVPFFIKGGAAYARGRGNVLKYFTLPKMSVVIYYPGYSISTQWAYDAYDKMILTPKQDLNIVNSGSTKKKKQRMAFQLDNDFEPVVYKQYPDLLDVKMNLIAAGAFLVSLSGSGSCLYTIVDDSTRSKAVNYLEGIGAQFFEVSTI